MKLDLILKKVVAFILCCFIFDSSVRKLVRSRIIRGKSCNKLFVIKSNGKQVRCVRIKGLKVIFQGGESVVRIHEPYNFSDSVLTIKNNSEVEILGSKYSINNLYITTNEQSKIYIGKNFSCHGCIIENHDERNLSVSIGDDCMFSHGIKIRVSDGHTIYENDTRKIINRPKSGVKIGNHVWIGMDTRILKDVSIPDNSIVGACSLVTKSFDEENVIIAGSPAKIIKHNINWDRHYTDYFESDDIYS